MVFLERKGLTIPFLIVGANFCAARFFALEISRDSDGFIARDFMAPPILICLCIATDTRLPDYIIHPVWLSESRPSKIHRIVIGVVFPNSHIIYLGYAAAPNPEPYIAGG